MLQVTLISFLYHMSVAACTVRVFPLDKIHIKLRKPDFQPFIFFPPTTRDLESKAKIWPGIDNCKQVTFLHQKIQAEIRLLVQATLTALFMPSVVS